MMTEITKDELLKRGFEESRGKCGKFYRMDFEDWNIEKDFGEWHITHDGTSEVYIPISKMHEIESFYKLVTKKELGGD